MRIDTVNSYDTDHFGTFSREVPRQGSAHDSALAKAQLACSLGATRYGLGSEGSFARDPHLGWMPWDYEILCLWDAQLQYPVFALAGSGATNYAQAEVDSLQAAEAFMQRARFPEHALILGRPGEAWFRKGIRQRDWLLGQLEGLLTREPSVWLETDMRAHLNPLRQVVIREAAAQLAQRLASFCPHCAAPGFAVVRSEPGLLCADCGLGTPLAAAHIWACPACQHEERRPVSQLASAGHCEQCNP
ncbi:MAG: hypothetical protein E6Q69_14510 [Aquipseudomonas alcaligenes]|uniref:DUF6671 domain-containing protein n=1 Tax=Aquipseudomonas alcaligenes TaxID=43263 RepID=A0A5C7VZL7_AQUAC|nr:MAG: hypothetical protein E6Q69_14510 [Pseudomonas alcaligenes]